MPLFTLSEFEKLPPEKKLALLATALNKAERPEVIFGPEAGAKTVSRKFMRFVHPDTIPGKDDDALAVATFQTLTKMWEWAEDMLDKGTYGKYDPKTISNDVRIAGNTYSVGDVLWRDDVAECRHAKDSTGKVFLLRVAISPDDNELIEREERILKEINASQFYKDYGMNVVIPTPVGLVRIGATNMAILLDYGTEEDGSPNDITNIRPLRQVVEYHNRNTPLRGIGWVWNRLWAVITCMHDIGFIHAGLTPDNILVDAATHSILLSNFGHASKMQEQVVSIAAEWQNLYPPEIYPKQEMPVFGSDTFMMGMSLIWAFSNLDLSEMQGLYGKIPASGVPNTNLTKLQEMNPNINLPNAIWDYLRFMINPNVTGRPYKYIPEKDLWADVLHGSMGWKREFVTMPFDPKMEAIDWSWWW